MHVRCKIAVAFLAGSTLALAGCQTAPPPPPMVPPATLTPLGLNAPYLHGDVIGGQKSRAAKMAGAKIRALTPASAPAYMAGLEQELRRQTAGIGLDVLRVGQSLVIRIPAALTFDSGSANVDPRFDATLLEIARTVKTENRTFVDVFAHTDLSGTAAVNQSLSARRAQAVANYLASHGVSKARMASKGLGQTAPLYSPEANEDQKAANRRVEIRLVPFIR